MTESIIVTAPPVERREGDRRAANRQLSVRLPAMPWQEDGRFGMTLIIIVAIVNIVLALVLTKQQATTRTAPSAPIISLRDNNSAMPSPISRADESNVTIYSEPHMLEESTRSMNLKSYAPNDNDFSIQAEDNPPPVARALEDRER